MKERIAIRVGVAKGEGADRSCDGGGEAVQYMTVAAAWSMVCRRVV